MKRMQHTILALLLALAAIPASSAELVGEAVDIESGVPIYTERHIFSAADGQRKMQSRYLNSSDQLIAERTVSYQGERVADYQLTLTNSEYREQIRRLPDSLSFFVDTQDDGTRSETVEVNAKRDIVIDAGINDYILRNWDALLRKEKQRFSFASTAQMDLVKLQVRLDEKASTEQLAIFSMTAANPIIRLLIDPVKVGFYRNSRQLAYYRGISNLKNEQGKAYKVEITFEDGQLDTLQPVAGN